MVYFITDGRYTKIGVAEDPNKRVKELQTGNPFKLSLAKVIDGSYEEEKQLHDMLHLYQINGEWYDWDNFDDEVIELLLTETPSLVKVKKVKAKQTVKDEIYSIFEKMKNTNNFIQITSLARGMESDRNFPLFAKWMKDFRKELDKYNKDNFGTSSFHVYRNDFNDKIRKALKSLNQDVDTKDLVSVSNESGVPLIAVESILKNELFRVQIHNTLNGIGYTNYGRTKVHLRKNT